MGEPLKVTIVGAGLAGLLAARVLREKHTVTVVEKFPGGHEVGAAINLGPNGVRIIEELGFDQTRCQSVPCGETRTLHKNGTLLVSASMKYLKEMYGAEWLFQHRADLWNEFLRLAVCSSQQLGISGQPATILWGHEVINVDIESGDVFLSDGRKLESDLVVGKFRNSNLLFGIKNTKSAIESGRWHQINFASTGSRRRCLPHRSSIRLVGFPIHHS